MKIALLCVTLRANPKNVIYLFKFEYGELPFSLDFRFGETIYAKIKKKEQYCFWRRNFTLFSASFQFDSI